MNLAFSANMTGTPYQQEKYTKHIDPTSASGISVYDDSSYSAYYGNTMSALASGFLEVDNYGRTNRVWDAGHVVGKTYGPSAGPRIDNAIKVVFPYDLEKIHHFSTSLTLGLVCSGCGQGLT
jgi:hypothetical protein